MRDCIYVKSSWRNRIQIRYVSWTTNNLYCPITEYKPMQETLDLHWLMTLCL